MRKDFEMTQEDLDTLLAAMKPTPVMYLSGGTPMYNTPQENANAAWKRLGDRMGFDHMTVRSNGKGDRFFSAEVKEVKEPNRSVGEVLAAEAEGREDGIQNQNGD